MEEYNKTLDVLLEKYGVVLNRKQLADAIGVSISTIDNRIASGKNLPKYKKDKSSPKSSLQFPAVEVAKYLCSDLT